MFAPTKNPTGVDSVESCREMLIARDLRRLRAAGVTVGENVKVELSPRRVFDDADAVLLAAEKGISEIPGNTEIVIG